MFILAIQGLWAGRMSPSVPVSRSLLFALFRAKEQSGGGTVNAGIYALEICISIWPQQAGVLLWAVWASPGGPEIRLAYVEGRKLTTFTRL